MNLYWNIEKRRNDLIGHWEYRLVEKTRQPYVTQGPKCPKCGHKMAIRDDRQ